MTADYREKAIEIVAEKVSTSWGLDPWVVAEEARILASASALTYGSLAVTQTAALLEAQDRIKQLEGALEKISKVSTGCAARGMAYEALHPFMDEASKDGEK